MTRKHLQTLAQKKLQKALAFQYKTGIEAFCEQAGLALMADTKARLSLARLKDFLLKTP